MDNDELIQWAIELGTGCTLPDAVSALRAIAPEGQIVKAWGTLLVRIGKDTGSILDTEGHPNAGGLRALGEAMGDANDDFED